MGNEWEINHSNLSIFTKKFFQIQDENFSPE
ncbi:hypothetical protein ES703_25842 [subsurface metagenome]